LVLNDVLFKVFNERWIVLARARSSDRPGELFALWTGLLGLFLLAAAVLPNLLDHFGSYQPVQTWPWL
jgi:hypothetical protein